jgi:hypothetical protein
LVVGRRQGGRYNSIGRVDSPVIDGEGERDGGSWRDDDSVAYHEAASRRDPTSIDLAI